MYMRARTKADYFKMLNEQGITGELSKLKMPHHTGWYNNIIHYGYYFCDRAEDAEKALQIFIKCGFNYCQIEGTRCIKIMHDTKI